MRNFILVLLFILVCSFQPVAAEPFKLTLSMVLAFIVGLYEVVIRIVPTAGQYGIIGKIIEVLAWLSNFLNVKKK